MSRTSGAASALRLNLCCHPPSATVKRERLVLCCSGRHFRNLCFGSRDALQSVACPHHLLRAKAEEATDMVMACV